MKIWNVAIDNRVAVYILMLIIVVLGAQAYMSLPREAAPDVKIPYIIVAIPYVGVAPADVEGLVTQPLERELKSIKDVKQITSSSKEGLSTTQVEFETGVDIDEALRRVRDKVNTTRSKLPTDIIEPIISEINISEFPIMFVNIGGTVGLPRLKKLAESLQDKFEAIPGVLSADITGALEPEVQVNCDVNRLKGYDVSFGDVINAIKGEHITIPGGSIDDGRTDFTVRVPGEYKDPVLIRDIVVKTRNGQPIYLRDVADVRMSYEDRSSYSRLNGKEAVTVAVKKRAGENLVRIADEVKRIIAEDGKTFPAGVAVDITNDQSKNVKRMVADLENSIITGMFLVVLVLFMFFGLKNSALISTSIPLSLMMGSIILSAFGITLNIVVLFSLVLVLGIVVDDAIVVIENIYRHQQEYGEDLIVAAKKAASEVAVPVATSTFTTVAAFLPLLFWPGIVGDFMKYLPITVIVTMLSSLFVAYVISPVQGSKFINYRKEIAAVKRKIENPTALSRFNIFDRTYHWVDEKIFPAAQHNYLRALRWTLRHKGVSITGAFALLVLSIVLFGMFNAGVEFFPDVQPNVATVLIEMPPGTPLEVTNQVTREVERRVRTIDGVRDIEFAVSNVGASNNPFDFGGSKISNKANVSTSFYEKALRQQDSHHTIDEMRQATSGIAGATVRVEKQQMGPPVGKAVSIEVSGDDFRQLAAISDRVKNVIRSVPGLVDLDDDYNAGKPEVQVIVDREKAALLELNTAQIGMLVRSAVNGTEAAKYRIGEDEYKITVRMREDQRQSLEDIRNLNITFMNRRGQQLTVPITSVAEVVRTAGVSDIRRKDYKRVVTITGDAQGRLANDILKDAKDRLASMQLPEGYSINFTGQQKDQDEASAFLTRALVITLLLVFLILVAEFNSVKVPLVIMISVLLSLIGVLLGLLVTRQPFGVVMTGVGVVSLAGIVVKNAIVLLDFTKHLKGTGLTLDEALLEAGKTRLRPVVLTAVATMLGVLPLATGVDFDWFKFHLVIGSESSDFWRSLGIAIIAGLSVSTFLTLIIVPTVYSYIDEKSALLSARVRTMLGRPAVAAVDED